MIRPRGADLSIASGLREFRRATPQAEAVIDGDRRLTFRALDERANRFAQALLATGMVPGDRIAVLAANRLEYVEIIGGVAKAGMVLVPLNPRLTASEIAYLLDHSQARVLVTDDDGYDDAAEVLEARRDLVVFTIGGRGGRDYESAIDAANASDPWIDVAETEPFCLLYTSGTTGRPKGSLISHRSRVLTFYLGALEWGLGPGARTLAVAPFYHGAGLAFGYGAVFTGATCTVLRKWDPEHFLDALKSERATSVFLVPTHAQTLRTLGEDRLASLDIPDLKTIYFNAAPLPQTLKEWVLDSLPEVGLHELYGSTEAGIVSDLRPADARRKVNCVGLPWFMTQIRVVDSQGETVEGEGIGELFSRSPFLMSGYLDDDEATMACTTDDGYLSAGDVVRVDDEGYLYVIDRTKDLIITGGVNVYPREVENVLSRHTAVDDVAVVGGPSKQWGEQVVAFVVLRHGAHVSPEELDQQASTELATYKRPRRYEYVSELPKNAAGKTLKRELRERLSRAADMQE